MVRRELKIHRITGIARVQRASVVRIVDSPEAIYNNYALFSSMGLLKKNPGYRPGF
jgi:hypothetical protein